MALKILEVNVVHKKYEKGQVKVALLYPNKYPAGIESLAMQILYMLFNLERNFICQRVYVSPSYSAVETGMKLTDFHVICVTLQYENDYFNLINALRQSNINPRSDERGLKPLIIGGGPCVTENPLPLSPFIDIFFIGEVEPIFQMLKEAIETYVKSGRIDSFSKIPGVYIPRTMLGKQVYKVWVRNLDQIPYPTGQVLPTITGIFRGHPPGFGAGLLLEVSRGCPRKCSFCLIGCQNLPYRERSLTVLEEIIKKGLIKTSRKRVSIIASAFSDYSSKEELLSYMVDHDIFPVLPSIRADSISEDIIRLIRKAGEKGMTLAPETASDRLQGVINKGISLNHVLDATKKIIRGGIKKIKLYFMYGLPSETLQETLNIIDMVNSIASQGFRKKDITVNLTPFVPKPHTPMQSEPQMPLKELLTREKLLLKELSMHGYNVKSYDVKQARIQTVLSRGDLQVGEALELAVKYGGGWSGWMKAVRDFKLDEEHYTGGMDDSNLPWSFIKVNPFIKELT